MKIRANAWILAAMLVVIIPLASGCITPHPHYSLIGRPANNQQALYKDALTGIETDEDIGNLKLAAIVNYFMDKDYIVLGFTLTNTSPNSIQLTPSSFQLQCQSPTQSVCVAALNPDLLVSQLEKQHKSKEKSRAFNTLFLAALASSGGGSYSGVNSSGQAYSGTYSTFNNGEFVNIMGKGSQANVSISDYEANQIAFFDRFLLRQLLISPGNCGQTIIVFPFERFGQSDKYKFAIQLNNKIYPYNFELREY